MLDRMIDIVIGLEKTAGSKLTYDAYFTIHNDALDELAERYGMEGLRRLRERKQLEGRGYIQESDCGVRS